MGAILSSSEFDPAQLVAHRDFVRALARRLVLGDEAADELTQQTMAAALVARPEPGSKLRGWLAKVLLRLRDRGRRDDERRVRRERGAAAPEWLTSTVDLASRIETEQRVGAAFGRLAEPYRSTLFLRYWHDLAPREIAAQLDVPVATVKTRLRRGLARMRTELDAAHEGRRDSWAGLLLPLAPPPRILEGLIMGTKAKFAVAAVVVLVAGATWWGVENEWPAGESSASNDTDRPSPAAEVAAAKPAETAATDAEVTRVAALPQLPFATGFVVDPDDRPLADVLVVPLFLDRREKRNVHAKPFIFDEAEARSITRTDAAGAFRVSDMPGDASTLALVKDGWEVFEWNGFSPNHDENQGHKIVLRPAREIRGIVRDCAGAPVERAMVWWFVPYGTSESLVASHLADAPSFHPARSTTQRFAYSDASGSFRVPSLAADHGRLWIFAHGYAFFDHSEDELAPGFEVSLRRNHVIFDVREATGDTPIEATGVVLDATTGALISDLHASYLDELPDHQRRMKVPGRIVLHVGSGGMDAFAWWLTPENSPHSLVAWIDAPGHLASDVTLQIDRDHEPPALVVRLAEGEDVPSLAGKVVGGSEGHIEVRPVITRTSGSEIKIDLERDPPLAVATSGADGHFAIGGLPAGRYRIDATARGYAPITARVDAPDLDVTLAFEAAGALEIAVVDRAGKPVPRVDVHLQLADGSRAWNGRTNDEGTLVAESLPAGDFLVGAFPKGLRYTIYDDDRRPFALRRDLFLDDERVTLAVGERRRFEVALPEPTAFLFRVVDQHETPLAGATLTIWPQGGLVTRIEGEDDRIRALEPRTDTAGEARVDLLSGRHWVTATFEGIKAQLDVEVPRAAEGSFTITVPVYDEFGVVEGRLFELGSETPLVGRPVAAYLEVQGKEDAEIASGTTDADGCFCFERVPAGAVRVVAWGNSGADRRHDAGSPWHSTSLKVRVTAGKTTCIDVPIARVAPFDPSLKAITLDALVRDAATGAPLAGTGILVQGHLGEARLALGSVGTGPDGRATLLVPHCERYEVRVASPRRAPDHAATHEDLKLSLESRAGRLEIDALLKSLASAR